MDQAHTHRTFQVASPASTHLRSISCLPQPLLQISGGKAPAAAPGAGQVCPVSLTAKAPAGAQQREQGEPSQRTASRSWEEQAKSGIQVGPEGGSSSLLPGARQGPQRCLGVTLHLLPLQTLCQGSGCHAWCCQPWPGHLRPHQARGICPQPSQSQCFTSTGAAVAVTAATVITAVATTPLPQGHQRYLVPFGQP